MGDVSPPKTEISLHICHEPDFGARWDGFGGLRRSRGSEGGGMAESSSHRLGGLHVSRAKRLLDGVARTAGGRTRSPAASAPRTLTHNLHFWQVREKAEGRDVKDGDGVAPQKTKPPATDGKSQVRCGLPFCCLADSPNSLYTPKPRLRVAKCCCGNIKVTCEGDPIRWSLAWLAGPHPLIQVDLS